MRRAVPDWQSTSTFYPVAGSIEGKDRLREEGFLIYDLVDIEAACTPG